MDKPGLDLITKMCLETNIAEVQRHPILIVTPRCFYITKLKSSKTQLEQKLQTSMNLLDRIHSVSLFS